MKFVGDWGSKGKGRRGNGRGEMDKKEREKLKETLVTFLRQTSTLIGHCVFLEICGKLSVEMG